MGTSPIGAAERGVGGLRRPVSFAPLGLRQSCRREPTARAIGIYTSQERPVSLVLLPLLLTQEGGEGRGEEALLLGFPSLRLSPHSFLAGREGLV